MPERFKVNDRVWVRSPNPEVGANERTEGVILDTCEDGWVVRLGDSPIKINAPERFLTHMDAVTRLGDTVRD